LLKGMSREGERLSLGLVVLAMGGSPRRAAGRPSPRL
jgi:hypothetical protein